MPGEAEANATDEVVVENDADDKSQNPDPMLFSVGEEDESAEKPADKKETPEEVTKPDESSKNVDELKTQVAELQKQLNRKFYNMRQERKAKAGEPEAEKPKFTDAQLLKILEEHKDDPAVTLQVIKHYTEQASDKTKKEAVEDTALSQKKQQADAWLKQNIPDLYDDGSELRAKTDEMRDALRLQDHPLGDFLTVAANQMAALPNILAKAREEERKKVLAEMAETNRKKDVAGGGPAGGRKDQKSGGAGEDLNYRATGKSIGLVGSALDLYVTMRRQAKNQRQVMEA